MVTWKSFPHKKANWGQNSVTSLTQSLATFCQSCENSIYFSNRGDIGSKPCRISSSVQRNTWLKSYSHLNRVWYFQPPNIWLRSYSHLNRVWYFQPPNIWLRSYSHLNRVWYFQPLNIWLRSYSHLNRVWYFQTPNRPNYDRHEI